MSLARLLVLAVLFAAPLAAQADEGYYPIKADDGETIANHRVPVEIESQIEKLPGIVAVGNPHGDVTLVEFYDVNCPFCRAASPDIEAMLKGNPELRLILVPFPVLGIPSIQGTRVELAVARLTSAQNFYKFHRLLDSSRGTVDGSRAIAAAQAVGLDVQKVLKIANEDKLADVMTAHLKLGDALAIQATPGFVIKGVAIVGYPGPKSLAEIIASVEKCGVVICQ
ncbi:MAG TPA: thioredoxin domain-containing protein [Pseudolabrys sp.]|uniref:thioredoxin domain-containing protein n=1 Tax=Pseudolabrys sp. TaxID=1960880 RepID=UPI002DDCB543|nr:thioredoxin domain-containing protein [Pseudolabrys sp.]HEV2627126.1 thioredoxin domain-containing protein [Pseudolabrys sp.]